MIEVTRADCAPIIHQAELGMGEGRRVLINAYTRSKQATIIVSSRVEHAGVVMMLACHQQSYVYTALCRGHKVTTQARRGDEIRGVQPRTPSRLGDAGLEGQANCLVAVPALPHYTAGHPPIRGIRHSCRRACPATAASRRLPGSARRIRVD